MKNKNKQIRRRNTSKGPEDRRNKSVMDDHLIPLKKKNPVRTADRMNINLQNQQCKDEAL